MQIQELLWLPHFLFLLNLCRCCSSWPCNVLHVFHSYTSGYWKTVPCSLGLRCFFFFFFFLSSSVSWSFSFLSLFLGSVLPSWRWILLGIIWLLYFYYHPMNKRYVLSPATLSPFCSHVIISKGGGGIKISSHHIFSEHPVVSIVFCSLEGN